MTEINFKIIFDRGMSKMERYVTAPNKEDAYNQGVKMALELCAEGLDTVLVDVFDQADDEYYD